VPGEKNRQLFYPEKGKPAFPRVFSLIPSWDISFAAVFAFVKDFLIDRRPSLHYNRPGRILHDRKEIHVK